jgi:hypothetical protein
MPRRPRHVAREVGPVAQFAAELRELRDHMGDNAPTIDQISIREGVPRSTLYAALKGARLPNRDVVAALVRSWGGDVAEWLTKRSAVELEPAERPPARTLPMFDDNPTQVDLLGSVAVVNAVEEALRIGPFHTFTVCIDGPWGSGKSSVMNTLMLKLSASKEYVTIAVNPWMYSDSQEIQATLAVKVTEALQSHSPGWDSDQRVVTTERGSLSMTGFRDNFATMLECRSEIRRLVVFIDDLDRCAPRTIMAILDLIQRYLAVPKTAFILAADQRQLHRAIADSTDGNESFATAFLAKAIQLVVSVPELTQEGTTAYLRHLWRHTGLAGLADQITASAAAIEAKTPRDVKRLVNQLAIRANIVQQSGVDVGWDELVKLYLLEQQFPDQFMQLVSMTDQQQQDHLRQWEEWAHGRSNTAPDRVPAETRDWARSEPALRGHQISQYLRLAASLSGLTREGL